MQGGFSRIPLPKEKFSFLFALLLMGRHIFVSSTFGLLAVFLTSRCEVLVSKQEVPCGMRDDFLKFVVLSAVSFVQSQYCT
jgi:hypothetical protein